MEFSMPTLHAMQHITLATRPQIIKKHSHADACRTKAKGSFFGYDLQYQASKASTFNIKL